MSKKGGNFFEEHVEKIVLAIVAVVCIWLLVSRVLVSPNKVEYRGNKFSPGRIDDRIKEQAEDLEGRLNSEPKPKPAYEPRKDGFLVLVEGNILDGNSSYADLYPLIAERYSPSAKYAIGNIDINVDFDLPANTSFEIIDDREYRLPLIGKVTEATAGHIRAVAYLPTSPVDEQNAYDEAGSEPNDVDFVTVEAKFDVVKLYENFHESFVGEDVPEEWRDPCLARPIFAVVQVQRRELLADSSWSDWQDVPRTRVDHRKKMFESILGVENLSLSGIKMLLFRFDKWQVRRDLLQPEAYRVASAEEEWFPPSLHEKYLDIQKKIEAQERREAIEAERKEEEYKREGAFGRPERGRHVLRGEREMRDGGPSVRQRGDLRETTAHSREPWSRGRRGLPLGRGDREEQKRSGRRFPKTKDSSKSASTDAMDDLYDGLGEILIAERTDISKMREPLVFWAHDDTVEPDKNYQYRIRLGVLNPIAGTDWAIKQAESRKNDVILWSEFSEETETVEIPRTLYFFPLNIREAAKIVDVKVSTYVLGYWYGWTFPVQQGEVIGEVREGKEMKDRTTDAKGSVTVPETIDYGTGAVLVDVTTVNDWSGRGGKNLHSRVYSDMLYSFDGAAIEHMPIKQSCWPKELQIKYNEIKKLEKKPIKSFRPFGDRAGLLKRRPTRRGDERRGTTEDEDEERGRYDDNEAEKYRQLMGHRG
jgi:hypothetical protein